MYESSKIEMYRMREKEEKENKLPERINKYMKENT